MNEIGLSEYRQKRLAKNRKLFWSDVKFYAKKLGYGNKEPICVMAYNPRFYKEDKKRALKIYSEVSDLNKHICELEHEIGTLKQTINFLGDFKKI